jgi:hypothetical protein
MVRGPKEHLIGAGEFEVDVEIPGISSTNGEGEGEERLDLSLVSAEEYFFLQ